MSDKNETNRVSEGIDSEYTNVRVQDARHAWMRGYRDQSDRTLALTDSRNPDLGPWSGVTATTGEGFGRDDSRDAYEGLTYFAKAPDSVEESDRDTLGPTAVSTNTGDGTLSSREWVEIGGTEQTVTVATQET